MENGRKEDNKVAHRKGEGVDIRRCVKSIDGKQQDGKEGGGKAGQGGKVMNTGGKGGQKLKKRNEKAASGKKKQAKAVYHIIKREDG